MKIIEITYGGTINTGNYQNIKLELKATVDDPTDTPTSVLERLKDKFEQEKRIILSHVAK